MVTLHFNIYYYKFTLTKLRELRLFKLTFSKFILVDIYAIDSKLCDACATFKTAFGHTAIRQ